MSPPAPIVPAVPPESETSGTRHVAFLRPMPGERRGSDSETLGEGITLPGPSAAAGDVPVQLFPTDSAGNAVEVPPGAVAGIRLGHFVIEERIGSGGMGAVFRAVDERLNRVVALKVLSPQQSHDPSAVERFHNEAQAAARLDHENIARVHYIGEDRGMQFIAFEFVRGTNVRDFILQKGTIAPHDAVNYTLQIAQALRHTMAAGVVHRDIKPSNIIITPAGHAKLVDLGLARQDRDQELTTFGTTLGTFDYIAPEQARDPRDVDVRADIYSLGCTLYHMLAGEAPFPRGTFIAKVIDHHRDTPPDPAERNRDVPPQLSRIVRRMMATNRDERYATPDHLIHDLTLVADALGLRPVNPDHVVWARPLYEPAPAFWENNRGWLLTVAILLVIAVGIDRVPWQMFAGQEDAAQTSTVQSGSASAADPGARQAAETAVLIGAAPNSDPSVSAPDAPQPDGVGKGMNGLPAELTVRQTGRLTSGTEPGPPAVVASDTSSSPPSEKGEFSDGDSIASEIEIATRPLPNRPGAETTTPDPSAAPAAAPFVVLDPLTKTEQTFNTLEAACQSAPNDGRIELRFDGLWPRPQSPIRIHGKRIVIAAQTGRHPSIAFQSATDPGRNDVTQMISVTEGGLTMEDVGLVVPVKTALSERWSLFSLAQTENLDLRGVSIVVENPQRLPATVVEIVPPRNLDPLRMMPDSMMRRQVVLDWQDCLIRGDCDLIVQDTLDPADIRFENLAIALRGALARVNGREALDGRVSDDKRLDLRLRHVTALLGDGMLRVETDLFRDFTPLNISCEDSIVSVRPGQALLALSAHQDLDTLRRRIQWQSSWSYFEVTGPVLQILQELQGDELELGADELGLVSEQLASEELFSEPVPWDQADVASLSPARCFSLRRTPIGAAVRAGSAGAQWNYRLRSAEDGSVTSTGLQVP